MTPDPLPLPEAVARAVKWLRKLPAPLRSMYRAGSRTSYAEEARMLADALLAAQVAGAGREDAYRTAAFCSFEVWKELDPGRRLTANDVSDVLDALNRVAQRIDAARSQERGE